MTTSIPTQPYVGLDIYVGIDVHQKTYTVVVQVEQTQVKKWTRSASPPELAEQLLRELQTNKIPFRLEQW